MDRLQIIANELRGELNTMWNGIAKLLASQVKYLDPQLAHDSRSRSLYGRYARIRHSIRVEMPECATCPVETTKNRMIFPTASSEQSCVH